MISLSKGALRAMLIATGAMAWSASWAEGGSICFMGPVTNNSGSPANDFHVEVRPTDSPVTTPPTPAQIMNGTFTMAQSTQPTAGGFNVDWAKPPANIPMGGMEDIGFMFESNQRAADYTITAYWTFNGVETPGTQPVVTLVNCPELDPGSLTSALTLLGGGTLTLTGRRRRKMLPPAAGSPR